MYHRRDSTSHSSRSSAALALALLCAPLSGCTTVAYIAPVYARVTNLSEEACATSLSAAVESVLVEQGEAAEDAHGAAARALRSYERQSRPDADPFAGNPSRFEAACPSGVSYWFVLQPANKHGCVLRLYEKHKEGAVESNSLTYFATRRPNRCRCDSFMYTEQTKAN